MFWFTAFIVPLPITSSTPPTAATPAPEAPRPSTASPRQPGGNQPGASLDTGAAVVATEVFGGATGIGTGFAARAGGALLGGGAGVGARAGVFTPSAATSCFP